MLNYYQPPPTKRKKHKVAGITCWILAERVVVFTIFTMNLMNDVTLNFVIVLHECFVI